MTNQHLHSELTEKIIGCFFRVHNTLGPGFLESIYRNALMIALRLIGLRAESEKEVRIFYEGEEVGIHRFDIVVEDKIIIETKTVDELHPKHFAQLRSYLKAGRLNVGLLVNFAKESVEFHRIEEIV